MELFSYMSQIQLLATSTLDACLMFSACCMHGHDKNDKKDSKSICFAAAASMQTIMTSVAVAGEQEIPKTYDMPLGMSACIDMRLGRSSICDWLQVL